MKMIRLMFASVLAVCSVTSANAAFSTFTFTGPAAVLDNSTTNMNITVPDGIALRQFQSLSITFSTPHTFVGDLVMTLTHVESGLTMNVINRPGKTSTTTGFGSGADFAGPYTFSNLLTLTNPAQPRVIDNANVSTTVTSGVYLPTTNLFNGNGTPTFTGETVTNFNTTFDTIGAMGGTWRLSVSDGAGGDTGTVGTWSFTADVTGTPAPAGLWLGLAGAGALGLLRRRK